MSRLFLVGIVSFLSALALPAWPSDEARDRRKFDYFAYAFARIVRNECAFGEVFPACDHAVSDCGYFIRAFYDAVFGIGQYFENFFDRDLVIREIFIDRYFFFPGMLEKRVAYAYSVGYAFGKDLFRFHFKQTVFE